jgi:hypothetical protein
MHAFMTYVSYDYVSVIWYHAGMMEMGWGKVSFPKGGKCSILIQIKHNIFVPNLL